MSDWYADAEAYAAEKMKGPTAMPPATLGEIWTSTWSQPTLSGMANVEDEAWTELSDAIRSETGVSPGEFTDNWGGRGTPPFDVAERGEIVRDYLGKLADKGQRDRIAPLTAILDRAREKQTVIDERAADTSARTYGLSGHAVGFAAGAVHQMIDPANWLPFAGGAPLAGAGVSATLKAVGREFAIGAAGGGAAWLSDAAERERLGLPHGGFGDFLYDVGVGGAMNAGLAGLFRGGARVARYLKSRGIEPPIDAADAHVLAWYAERRQLMEMQEQPQTPQARAEVHERTNRVVAAFESGRPVNELTTPKAEPRPVSQSVDSAALGPDQVVLHDGSRMNVRYEVMDLKDVVASHRLDGSENPHYPGELQPRARKAAASKVNIAEGSANLEPGLLGRSPTLQEGAPLVGPDNVVESGNGRAMMIARAYALHPERADAYKASLAAMGLSSEGIEHPILVRRRLDDVADRALLARQANISRTAELAPDERGFVDAEYLDSDILALQAGGDIDAAANVPFVRAFAERVVPPSERPSFVTAEGRLTASGRDRIEAALVAHGYGDRELVKALYVSTDPSSKAIIGALAENAGRAAQVKAEIAAGRLAPELDPAPALLQAYRLVERSRNQAGVKLVDLINQVDLEHGAPKPAVIAAVKQFFRDEQLKVPASRKVISAEIERTMTSTLMKMNAVGDLHGYKPDAAMMLREGRTAATLVDDLPIEPEEVATPPELAAVADIDKRISEANADLAWADTQDGRRIAKRDIDRLTAEREKLLAEANEKAAAAPAPKAEPEPVLLFPEPEPKPKKPAAETKALAKRQDFGVENIKDDVFARAEKIANDGVQSKAQIADRYVNELGVVPEDADKLADYTLDKLNEKAAAAPAKEAAPPPGDPQLQADADAVIAEVGDDAVIRLAEPEATEAGIRDLTIAEARAEVDDYANAADELLACTGLTILPKAAA